MKSIFNLRILLFIATSVPVHCIFNWNTTGSVIAFGDSYTYVQGTAGRQNYSFIGDAQKFGYNASTLLADEIVQNQIGTSAGGPNWVEYLTGCYSCLPSNCDKELWDFAFAGADVSTKYTALHHNFTVPFVDQVAQFNTYARPALPRASQQDLVIIWIGINDIGDTAKFNFTDQNVSSFPQLYRNIAAIEFDAVETLYDAGYVNFLFMNLPPLERTPLNVNSADPLPNKTMVADYNFAIRAAANSFEQEHPESYILEFDTYTFLSGILDDPSPSGIVNTTDYCPNYDAPDIATNYAAYGCLPIYEYFWYNTGHITYHVHQLLAAAVQKYLIKESMSTGLDAEET